MKNQLVIDSSGAWVPQTGQLIAEKPLLPPEHFGGLLCAAQHLFDTTSDQPEDTSTEPLDYKDC